ncbi:hypothetical protein WG906_13395 [Pedobacter sp. P351]|uniref:hypothetical protein n=1 Tax=Pedobacter superstes TaxID=3133441 RepID=UPI0030B7B03E
MAKETFDVKVILASEERILRIQSHQNEDDDTLFSVSAGSETLGVLQNGKDGWEWREGARSPEEANAIGCEIDAHFYQ